MRSGLILEFTSIRGRLMMLVVIDHDAEHIERILAVVEKREEILLVLDILR